MDDRTVGEKMTQDLGLNPGLSVNSDQRLEKLREQHAEDAEKDVKEEDI
ncbi:MAG: hypothetical protein GIW97_02415 [Candidatus Eremiobacteraeota bacterium]|nr:hypothetical protein [Candidatus Eremiobacteraeota bacterium]